jgi:CDP-paratose 2-epimerase
VSILEAFAKVEALTGRQMRWTYSDQARRGDHICYISDLRALRAAIPDWSITRSLDDIFTELVEAWQQRLA